MKKKLKKINVIEDFHPRPKWRYRTEGDGSGEEFRQDKLLPALSHYENVEVNLTGYNRYGPSFISEAFGGLIRDEGMRLEELQERLVIKHDLLPTVVKMAWDELKDAEKEIHGK